MAVVTIRLGTEFYGVPIAQVQEVIPCSDVAKPFAPYAMSEHVVGIYNLHGVVIPIVDLKARLGLAHQVDAEQQILVCRVQRSLVGFIVDEVVQVVKIPRHLIKPPSPTQNSTAARHTIGVATLASGPMIIIDLAPGLAPERASSPFDEI